MTLYGEGTRGDVERTSPERHGPDSALATDLIKSMAVSSAELWHDVLQRLTELQTSQVLLAQAIAEMSAVMHESLRAGSLPQVAPADSTPALAAASSVPPVSSSPTAPVESEAPAPATTTEPAIEDEMVPSEDASNEWTPPVLEPSGRTPKHRRGRSASKEEVAPTPARPTRVERRMEAQESKAAAKLEKVMANDAKVAAKTAAKEAKAAAKSSGKGGAVTVGAVTVGANIDEAGEAPIADETSTGEKKPSMFKRELSFGRKRRPAEIDPVISAPAEAEAQVGLLGSMQSFVAEDPGVFVDTTQAVQLPPPPPPAVTPPPPVVTPPPPVVYSPPAVSDAEPETPEPDLASAGPLPPQPLVYTPNRSANQFDVSALDPSPSVAPPADAAQVPEPVARFEPSAAVEPEPEPAFVAAPSAPARESSVTLASEILANAPVLNEASATPSEPQLLVISEDLTLTSKSRKRKQFRIR